MISNNVKRQVRREANLIRKFATQEERNRLDFASLKPHNSTLCIYGQMTGNCFSNRGNELAIKCGVPVSGVPEWGGFSLLPTKLWKRASWYSTDIRRFRRKLTAIEYYITLPEAQNKNLINYLKGQTNVLDI